MECLPIIKLERIFFYPTEQQKRIGKHLGIGPYISYDIWKSKSHWTGDTAFNFNFVSNLSIKQIDSASNIDEATFSANSLSVKSGFYYKKRGIVTGNLDLLAGFNINMSPPVRLDGEVERNRSVLGTVAGRSTLYD